MTDGASQHDTVRALLASVGLRGRTFFDDETPMFCEAVLRPDIGRHGHESRTELGNTVSNFLFLLLGLLEVGMLTRSDDIVITGMAVGMIFSGVGSALFHATGFFVTWALDLLPLVILLSNVTSALCMTIVQCIMSQSARSWWKILLRKTLLLLAAAAPWILLFIAVVFFLDVATVKLDRNSTAAALFYETHPAVPPGSLEPTISSALSGSAILAMAIVPLIAIVGVLEVASLVGVIRTVGLRQLILHYFPLLPCGKPTTDKSTTAQSETPGSFGDCQPTSDLETARKTAKPLAEAAPDGLSTAAHATFLENAAKCGDAEKALRLCVDYARAVTGASRGSGSLTPAGSSSSSRMPLNLSWWQPHVAAGGDSTTQLSSLRHAYGWHADKNNGRESSEDLLQDAEEMEREATLSIRMKLVGLFARALLWQVIAFALWLPETFAERGGSCRHIHSVLHPLWHVGSALALHHVICYIAFHRALLVNMDARLHWFPANYVVAYAESSDRETISTGRLLVLRTLFLFRIVPWVTWHPITYEERLELLAAAEDSGGAGDTGELIGETSLVTMCALGFVAPGFLRHGDTLVFTFSCLPYAHSPWLTSYTTPRSMPPSVSLTRSAGDRLLRRRATVRKRKSLAPDAASDELAARQEAVRRWSMGIESPPSPVVDRQSHEVDSTECGTAPKESAVTLV